MGQLLWLYPDQIIANLKGLGDQNIFFCGLSLDFWLQSLRLVWSLLFRLATLLIRKPFPAREMVGMQKLKIYIF